MLLLLLCCAQNFTEIVQRRLEIIGLLSLARTFLHRAVEIMPATFLPQWYIYIIFSVTLTNVTDYLQTRGWNRCIERL